MSLTEGRLTEAGGMRGLEASSNRVTEDYVTAGAPVPAIIAITEVQNNTTSTTVSKPAGGTAGDFYVIMQISVDWSEGFPPRPPPYVVGWKDIGSQSGEYYGTGGGYWASAFSKAHTGTEGSTFTVAMSESHWSYAYCVLVRDVEGFQRGLMNTDGGSTTTAIPGVTAATDDSLGLIMSIDHVGSTTHTASGWTLEDTGPFAAVFLHSKAIGAGATGDVTVTAGSSRDRLGGFMVVANQLPDPLSWLWQGASPIPVVDSTIYELGTRFIVNDPIHIGKIRIFNNSTASFTSRNARIWESASGFASGTVIHTVDIPDSMAQGISEYACDIDLPVGYYVISFTNAPDYYALSNGLDSAYTTPDGAVTIPIGGGRYTDSETTFPTEVFGNGYYGIDFAYEVT